MARREKKRSPAAAKALEVAGAAKAAKEFAESDTLKELMSSTGSAVKDFASNVSEAAKDLLESTEKAAGKAKRDRRKPRRVRKVMRVSAFLGLAAAIFGNAKVRNAIQAQVKKLRGQDEPPPWATQAAQTDGVPRGEPVAKTAP